jgi:hypothetical protein
MGPDGDGFRQIRLAMRSAFARQTNPLVTLLNCCRALGKRLQRCLDNETAIEVENSIKSGELSSGSPRLNPFRQPAIGEREGLRGLRLH